MDVHRHHFESDTLEWIPETFDRKKHFKVKDKTSPIFQHDAISNFNVWRETNLYFGAVVP